MIRKYLCKVTPLEGYTFGTDRGCKYEGTDLTGKETYIIESTFLPEQTTILGTLRYIALRNKGLLKPDYKYSPEEQMKLAKVVGESSFSFGDINHEEDFGVIKSISPIFLIGNNEKYVPTPFCFDEQGKLKIKLEEKKIKTSRGMIALPGKQYDSKEGYTTGFIGLSSRKVFPISEIFSKNLLTCNRTDISENNNDEAFYKKEVVSFKEAFKDFGFSFFLEADKEAFGVKELAYMGKGRSAFMFEFTAVEDCTLETQISEAFKGADAWYYCLSDVYAPGIKINDAFAIIEEKKIRNLETDLNSKGFTGKRRKTKYQIVLIKAGSVFKEMPKLVGNQAKYQKVGLNRIIKIGG